MAFEHSVEVVGKLAERFRQANVHRAMRIGRYEAGTELSYDVTGVVPANAGRVRLAIEKFIGGGFAGQVYRVRVLEIDSPDGPLAGLAEGDTYAIKILLPPSNKARMFRDFIYRVGFQGPFALQVNPSAARAGALWQKFIRRAAQLHFGDERAVVDVLATFVDPVLGSCGEISEWVEGRTWRFEVDDRLFARWRWKPGQSDHVGSPEYRTKKAFMGEFVQLLHELGAPEFARQYEWWTCKSQPNALKRLDTNDEPTGGLTAVDFRAGLALLPFLPMSPGDVPLIFKGLARGSLVQFDRGNLQKLRAFSEARKEHFSDMEDALEELTAEEHRYRNSQIDVTHNHVKLLYSGRLWSRILDGFVTGWSTSRVADESATRQFAGSRLLTLVFMMIGLVRFLAIPAAVAYLITALATGKGFWNAVMPAAALAIILPLLCKLVRRLWARGDYRRHLRGLLTSAAYFRRAIQAHIAETLIRWHRAGRVDGARAMKISDQPWRFFCHWPLSLLPVFLHRLGTDYRYALGILLYILVRPIRLYFNPAAREQWLREMVAEGQKRHMLTDEDADRILSRIGEPFIQKYLKSLAVHVCTLPVTQIVSVAIAGIWVWTHPERSTAWVEGLGIIAAFQVTPISPGSLTRGLYVLYLVIRERNFKDYNIAVFLGFFKYVGYLAFPIQMAYRYPALARFMAAHWATGAVNFVPVFGEHGALLEHGVFDLFYNYPLTIRRRMRERAELRAQQKPRAWHVLPVAAYSIALLAGPFAVLRMRYGVLPTLGDFGAAVILPPVLLGIMVTVWAGGASLTKRIRLTIFSATITGVGFSIVYAVLSLMPTQGEPVATGELVWAASKTGMWSIFILVLLATISALLTEINLPEAKERASDRFEQPVSQQQLANDVGVEAGDQVVQEDSPTCP